MAAGAGEQYGKCAERLPPGSHAGGSGRSAGPVRGGPPGAKGAEMKNAHACPKCGSTHIDKLQRITGYLVGTTDRWNQAKLAELNDRVIHEN